MPPMKTANAIAMLTASLSLVVDALWGATGSELERLEAEEQGIRAALAKLAA